MKRCIAVLVLIILSVVLLPDTSVKAGLARIPHEDPAAARSSFAAGAALNYYCNMLELLASGEYEKADGLSQQLRHANIPEDLRYTIDGYNELLLQLSETLSRLEEELDETAALVSQHRIEQALLGLEETGRLALEAEDILADLEKATQTLGERFGALAAPAESELKKAYDRLQGILERLGQLRTEYEKFLRGLEARHSTLSLSEKEPLSTEITLNVEPKRAFVGEPVVVWGTLASQGRALPQREIMIFVNGRPVATALSRPLGSYEQEVSLPYSYVPTTNLGVAYDPQGEDRDIYLASSASAEVEAMFYSTGLRVVSPETAYPRLPLVVGGEITATGEGPPPERRVKVFLDNALLAEAETSGMFETELTIPPQTSVGESTLSVSVEPQGRYAGIFGSKALNIVKALPQFDVRAPTFIVLPQEVHIRGKASSSLGPLRHAIAYAQLGGVSTDEWTSEEGEFEMTLDLPMDLVIVGPRELQVGIKPVEPWHHPAQARMKVVVINPASLGVISAGFIFLGVILYGRRRGKQIEKGAESLRAFPLEMETVAATPKARSEARFDDARERVLAAYIGALKVVEGITRVPMPPHLTLREFLAEVLPRLGVIGGAFAELTSRAEKALYSPHLPQEAEITQAEDLAMRVKEVLKSGNA